YLRLVAELRPVGERQRVQIKAVSREAVLRDERLPPGVHLGGRLLLDGERVILSAVEFHVALSVHDQRRRGEREHHAGDEIFHEWSNLWPGMLALRLATVKIACGVQPAVAIAVREIQQQADHQPVAETSP